jgi:hypothetical protein
MAGGSPGKELDLFAWQGFPARQRSGVLALNIVQIGTGINEKLLDSS